jgi:hypothetical protein
MSAILLGGQGHARGGLEAPGRAKQDRQRLSFAQRALSRHPVTRRLATNELHDHVVVVLLGIDVKDPHQVLVTELCGDLGLALEADDILGIAGRKMRQRNFTATSMSSLT